MPTQKTHVFQGFDIFSKGQIRRLFGFHGVICAIGRQGLPQNPDKLVILLNNFRLNLNYGMMNDNLNFY
ncbi:MAG: hypothetical protein R3D88_03200 [Alphaproteobacteria bacterium]|nr:hypothetical protein [Alphaproteobacteria bacterium]